MELRNKILSIMFLVLVLCTAVSIRFYEPVSDMLKVVLAETFAGRLSGGEDSRGRITEKVAGGIGEEAKTVLDALPYKTNMVEFNGRFLKTVGTRSFYNISHGMNLTSDGYNVGRYDRTSTDYEVQEMISFKKYLDEKGIQLLYVSEPAKYIDDSYYEKQFGGESYLNRNTDLFLSRISDAGIRSLDLRDNIRSEELNPLSLFYRTDHHWTVPASKWAAGLIAQKLNDEYGYQIDMSLFQDEKFEKTEYRDCWLGEQGKLVSRAYIGLDDYTMLEPVYPTSYRIVSPDSKTVAQGNFGVFINKSVYKSQGDYYSAPSWHYSYNAYSGNVIHNNNIASGNVLVLGDSYEASMLPFLSLGVQNITYLVPRNLSGSVREYVEKGNYDTVIIAYAQFMIGAHDKETSANYKMFTFD